MRKGTDEDVARTNASLSYHRRHCVVDRSVGRPVEEPQRGRRGRTRSPAGTADSVGVGGAQPTATMRSVGRATSNAMIPAGQARRLPRSSGSRLRTRCAATGVPILVNSCAGKVSSRAAMQCDAFLSIGRDHRLQAARLSRADSRAHALSLSRADDAGWCSLRNCA